MFAAEILLVGPSSEAGTRGCKMWLIYAVLFLTSATSFGVLVWLYIRENEKRRQQN